MSFFNGFWDLFDLLGFKRDKSSEQEAIQREMSGESSYGEGIAINKERLSRGNNGRGYNPFDITGGSSQTDLDKAGLTDGLPNLLGALASYFNAMTGADLTNAQKAQNQFNAQQAELQRDWETQMSNTAYQRVVADMQAGGINPAMAWSNGAASTPSGASASAGIASNGLDALSTLLQLKIQNKLADATIRKTNAEANKIETETPWIDTLNSLIAGKTDAEINAIKANTDLTNEQIENAKVAREQMMEHINLMISQEQEIDAKIDLMAAQAFLNSAEAWQIYKLAPVLEQKYAAEASLVSVEAFEIQFGFDSGQWQAVADSVKAESKERQVTAQTNEAIEKDLQSDKGLFRRVCNGLRYLKRSGFDPSGASVSGNFSKSRRN